MKLHLPKGLRAALIAAFGIIGFTLPQSYAEIAWSGGPQDTFGYTRVFYMNDGANATLTDTDDSRFLITSNRNGANPAAGEITSVVTKDGALMRISGGNSWGNDRILSPLIIDNVQAGDGSGTVNISTEQWNASRAASDTTVSILAVSGTVGSVENYGVLTLGSAGGTITVSGALNNHDGATLTIDGSYVFDVSDTSKYTLKSEGSVEWSDSANSQGFKKTTGSTYYAIKGATEGANIGDITSSSGTDIIRESSGNYYFEGGAAADFDYTRFYVKADTATLEHDGEGQIVVEKEGATLTVRNATYRDTSGSKNLNIVVGEGGVLEVTHSGGSGYVTGGITIQGGGTFRVAGQHDAFGWGDTTTKSIILQGSDDSHIATLDLQQTTGNSATMNAALKLMGNAAITGAKGFNTHDGSYYAEGVNNSIESFQIRHAATFEVKEGGELTVGTMTKGQDGNKTLTKTGMGTMTFTTKAQAEALVINEGAIVIAGSEENSFNSITIGASGTLKLTGSASLTMSGNLTSAGAIVKDGDGTLVFSGAQNVLSHVITLQGGVLTLSGAYDVSELASGGGGDGYIDGEIEGNGFLSHGELVAHVVDITDGASLSADGTFTANGAVGSFDTATGNATFGSGTSYSVYYVNVSGSAEGLAHAIEAAGAQGEQLGEVRLANGTALNLNSADAVLPLLAVAADADAALNVTENSTITRVTGVADGHALTVNGTAGATLTIGAATTDSFAGAGSLVIAEGATVLMQGNNTNFTGDIVINGTVLVGPGNKADNGTNSLGSDTIAETAARSITINPTGVLDFNGLQDIKYAYVLAGGKITNSGATIGDTKAQMSGLKLTANSTVEANSGHEYWLLSGGYAANKADLQGNTLVKTGDGQFGFRSTTITAGTLEVQAGSIRFNNSNTVADMLLTGGTFTGAVDVKDNITVTTRATADMSAALNIAEADKVVTFSVDAGQTHTQSGAVSGTGAIAKTGAGTLTLSAANTVTSVTLSEGTIKATAAGALGSGTTTVAAGTTLEMTVGNAVSGTGSVSNAGNVLIHNTLTAGTIAGGVLTLADDFAVTGDLEDVDGLTDTGNGFSLGGVLQVYDTASATLTNITSIVHGSDTYQLTDLVDGAISKGGANWTVYQLNQENDSQPTIQQIMDYATGKGATLASVAVNGEGLSLVVDTTTFKTSMLSGTDEHLATTFLLLDDGAVLGMDADVKGALYLTTDTESHATINLEKDAAVGQDMWVFNEGYTSNLTIDGAHTLSTYFLGIQEGTVTVQGGAHVVVTEADCFGMYFGDTLTVKGASEFSIPNTSIKSVDGAKDAVLTDDSSEYAYDIADPGYTLADAELTVGFADAHELGNVLSGAVAVVNAGAGTLTDVNPVNLAYDGLHAQGGNIVLQGRGEDVAVRNLTVDAGRSVSMTDTTAGIVVSGTATFGNGSSVGSALTMAGGSTLDGATALASHALSIESDVNIGDTLWSTLNALPAEGSANIFTGVSALTLAGAEYSDKVDLSDIFNHASLKPNKFSLSYDGSNVIVTKNLENNRYWKGGDGTWDYSEEKWTDEDGTGTDVPFVSGYNAHFTAASGGTVTLGVDITAASVYVSGADYTFVPNGHTLTVANAFEVDGRTATLQGLGLSGANLKLTAKNGGTLKIGANSSVKDVEIGSGSAIMADSSTLAVAGSLVNNGSLSAGTLSLSQGTAQGGNASVGTLDLADNKSYTFGNLIAAAISGNADLTIGADGSLRTNSSSLKSLSAGAGSQLAGTISVKGNTNADGAVLTGNLTTGTLTGGSLSVVGGNLSLSAGGSLGNVQFAGSSSLSAFDTVTLGGPLQNSGTLSLMGRFDASNLPASKSDSKYVEGGISGNGFEQARLTLAIVEGGATYADEAAIVYRGKTLSEDVGTDGRVSFDGDVDYTKYYVNSGTENASKALDNPSQDLGTFELAAGTTLVVDKNISMGMVNAAGAATMQIDAGSTVNTDGTTKNLTLTGAGTLEVDAGKTSTGVTLGGTWAGTVSYTEAQLTTLGGSWKSGSTVSLTGVTGSLSSDLIEGKVVLKKGTGDWGFGQTETSGTQYTNLENTLTGDGNLGVKSGSVDSTFNLNGNIDGWTGNFIVATDADTDLNLGGSGPKTVHGTVGGSNLVVNVNADTTFEGALSVAEINVNDSKTATLKADSTADRVDTSNGSLKVDNGKTLTVTGFTGPEGLKLGAGASIVLQGAAYMGGEDYGYVGGTVANSEGTDQDVTIRNADITVTGATLRVNGGSGFTVDNKLVNATLAVENGLPSTVTLNNVKDSLEVAGDLEIGPGGSLKVANGSYKQTLNISDGTTLTLANDTTLDADLTLNRGATLKLDYNMGSPVATTLNGGGLTLYKGLTLSGDLYETLKGLSTEGESVTLFSNVDTIVFDGATSPTVDASTYFTNLLDLEGDFTFNYDEGLLSIVYSESSSRQLVWDGTETEHRWVAYEPETITPEVKDWYQPSTETETHFVQGDTATFGSDAETKVVNLSAGETTAKMVTIKESADYEFVADAAGSKLSATRFEVKEGATLNKSGAGTLILEVGENVTVDTAGLFVDEGELVIGTAEMPGTLALDNGVMEVAEDATLRVAKIQDSEGSLIAVCGTLNVASGSLHAIHAIEGSTLVISNVNGVSAGTLAIDSDTTLHGLENHGTLDIGTHSLTLEEAAAQGGNVTAGTLNLAGNGNAFGNLKVNTIHYAYGAEGAGELGAVNVDTIAANGAFPVITLDLTDTMGDGGSLAPTNRTSEATTYTLIHADGQTLSTSNFMLGGNTLALLVQNGLVHADAGLETDGGNITLTVGGQDVTWNTDKDVTEWGYTVVSNDRITAGGDTFNGVEHLVVDASRRIDVTGAGSEPGLRVRNISGLDGRTITFTGTEDDTVNLIANKETSSNVNVAAENINLQVGLNQLDDIDPTDYEYLHVGSVTLTNADMAVNPEATLSVDSLNGDVNSGLQGVVIVEAKGGTYNGGYEDATVILHEDADQALAAGEGLTVMGLGLARITYSGAETHMDGIEGIGLRVMLNDEYTDNSHKTLTLDNEYSYIVDGALGVGLSAIESGITLDSEAAPDLLRAEHLEMTGSTLYIYQALSDGAALVMDVNDGGYKRGLLLAMLGAENTTADAVQLQGDLFFKYYQNPRLENGRVLVDRRTDYFTLVTEPTSENGQAGAGMLDDALLYNNPQATQQGGDLAVVMTALEQGGYSHAHADKVMAAMSGASQAAMGAAWNRDVDRQLRAIRNRTTQMGLAECTRHEGLPYFNAWINAEGDYAKLGADDTLAGYKLTSWGGTLGVDVDFTNRFTMGVAVTAMSGNFTADSAERAEGDLDRLYVSVFGRYTRRAWTHTFVATLGMADTKLERTVDYGYGSYNADSSSDGKAFGLMYEVGYVTALNEDSSSCLQPVLNLSYRHSSLAGCGEQSQSDAALRLGNADANVFTAAIGARLQSAVGTSVYNRTSIFEGRVMLKFDTGDRDVAANNSFVGVPGGRAAKSTEAGLFGVEVGAGLTIPLSENAGAFFFDVTGDFRAKDTEVNGTVGYRYNF